MGVSAARMNRSFVSRFASNINQICRRINSTGHFYDADVAELKERMADVWELLKVQQREELRPQRGVPCVCSVTSFPDDG